MSSSSGAATARARWQLAGRGANVIAVDPSIEAGLATRKRAETAEVRIELRTGDLADLAFLRGDSVDVAFAEGSLASLVRPRPRAAPGAAGAARRRVVRVLAPAPHRGLRRPPSPSPTARCPSRCPPSTAPTSTTTCRTAPRVHPHRIGDVFALLGRVGFRVDTLLEPEPPGDRPRPRAAPHHRDLAGPQGRELGRERPLRHIPDATTSRRLRVRPIRESGSSPGDAAPGDSEPALVRPRRRRSYASASDRALVEAGLEQERRAPRPRPGPARTPRKSITCLPSSGGRIARAPPARRAPRCAPRARPCAGASVRAFRSLRVVQSHRCSSLSCSSRSPASRT